MRPDYPKPASEKIDCQTPDLVTVITESASHSTVTSGVRAINISQESDLTLNVSRPEVEKEPTQTIEQLGLSVSNAKVPLINSDGALSHLLARFKAGETDILKFSHVAGCFGYERAIQLAKQCDWKVNY